MVRELKEKQMCPRGYHRKAKRKREAPRTLENMVEKSDPKRF